MKIFFYGWIEKGPESVFFLPKKIGFILNMI